VVNGALHSIALASGLHRINCVVVGRPWLEVVESHAEDRRCVIRVQPDRRFCGLDQAIWICTIVHDSVMHGGASAIVRRPVDNRQMLLRQADLRSLGDPRQRSFWSRSTLLADRPPPKIEIANSPTALFMFKPQRAHSGWSAHIRGLAFGATE
jgi:hypothetical protein